MSLWFTVLPLSAAALEELGSLPVPQVLEGSYHEPIDVSLGFPHPYPLLMACMYQTPLQELGYIPESARQGCCSLGPYALVGADRQTIQKLG